MPNKEVFNGDTLRVAVVLGEMGTGGIEQVVMNYYRHIDRGRVQFDFYVHEDSKNILKDEILSLGGTVTTIPNYSHVISYYLKLKKYLQQGQYKIVHIHLNTMSVFAQFAAWRAGVPIRITHNHSTAGKGEPLRNLLKYTLRLFANCFVTNRCACSKYAGRWMWGRHKKITVWPNAIDISKFRFNSETRKKMRERYNVENKFVIGHIGRFIEQKNHNFLIDVFYETQKQRPGAVLMLVGEGNLKSEIKEKVNKLGLNGKVIFVGATDKPWEFYNAFDCFVLPSLYEGLPIVGIEAQVSGLPCLFSDKITREVNFGDGTFIPIKHGVKPWVSALAKMTEKTDEERRIYNKRLNRYDINRAGKRLTEWYLNLVEEHSN